MPTPFGAVNNPTGKGGFRENPQNISGGFWHPENSQKFLLKHFMNMSVDELRKWEKDHPVAVRTVAQALALARVKEAMKDLKTYQEIVNRSEGLLTQNLDVKSAGEKIVGFNFIAPTETK